MAKEPCPVCGVGQIEIYCPTCDNEGVLVAVLAGVEIARTRCPEECPYARD
jgi:hypothetical protein